MEKIECRVRFVTPAFLGNAEQSGQWRTPPFKALLRQWWRVAYAAEHDFNVNLTVMRQVEGLLFGNAWLSHREGNKEITDHCKSLVRIRLDKWEPGTLKQWAGPDPTASHPEVTNPVGSQLYLGYGPLKFQHGTALKSNAAIQVGETANLSFAVPEAHASLLRQALTLMHHFGTLGGRSRNGWGSFTLTTNPSLAGAIPLRPWHEALALDWPHALGSDDTGPLIWMTRPHNDWKTLMRTLAMVKIGMRAQLMFTLNAANGDRPINRNGNQVGINHGNPQQRHWLSFPITNHPVSPWGGKARLPNSLRFKVRLAPDDPTKLVGVVFHVPCLPPSEFHPNRDAITRTWQAVHALLNELTRPAERRQYASITNEERRTRLRQQLDAVTLQRIQE